MASIIFKNHPVSTGTVLSVFRYARRGVRFSPRGRRPRVFFFVRFIQRDAGRRFSGSTETSLGDRIVSSLAKRVASEDPPDRENCSGKKAAFLICLEGIGRARRCEPACGVTFERRQESSVETYERDTNIFHSFPGTGAGLRIPSLTKDFSISSRTSGILAPLILPDAASTIRYPCPSLPSPSFSISR